MEKWLIRVIGKQRKDIDVDLVVQAVIALGRQLAEEAKAETERGDEQPQGDQHHTTTEPPRDKTTGAAS